jgi:hypothetical protein
MLVCIGDVQTTLTYADLAWEDVNSAMGPYLRQDKDIMFFLFFFLPLAHPSIRGKDG